MHLNVNICGFFDGLGWPRERVIRISKGCDPRVENHWPRRLVGYTHGLPGDALQAGLANGGKANLECSRWLAYINDLKTSPFCIASPSVSWRPKWNKLHFPFFFPTLGWNPSWATVNLSSVKLILSVLSESWLTMGITGMSFYFVQ